MAGPPIRRAVEADLPAMMELFHELDAHQRDWRTFEPRRSFAGDMAERYRLALADPSARLLVAEANGAVVGMALAKRERPSSFSEEEAVELSSVVVRSGHRGRGIGRALVAAGVDFARENGTRWVTIRTFARNEEALGFWRELGFTPRVLQMTARVGDLRL